jgi:Cytochrome c oxidase subunit IV
VAEGVKGPAESPPPPGEAVHLPGPSYLPVVVAAGVSITVVGVVISWILVALGLLVTLVAVVRWVRQTRSEMAELPLDH